MSKTDIASALRLTSATALALLLSSCAMVENAAHSFSPAVVIHDSSGNSLGAHPQARIDRVQTLVDSSIAASRAEGAASFIRDVNDNQRTLQGSYYLFVFDTRTSRIVANPVDPGMIGRHSSEIVDRAGRSLEHIFDDSNENGVWVTYKWSNPATGQDETKISWLKSADGYVFGSGLYVD